MTWFTLSGLVSEDHKKCLFFHSKFNDCEFAEGIIAKPLTPQEIREGLTSRQFVYLKVLEAPYPYLDMPNLTLQLKENGRATVGVGFNTACDFVITMAINIYAGFNYSSVKFKRGINGMEIEAWD
jgi:hypothetical protein